MAVTIPPFRASAMGDGDPFAGVRRPVASELRGRVSPVPDAGADPRRAGCARVVADLPERAERYCPTPRDRHERLEESLRRRKRRKVDGDRVALIATVITNSINVKPRRRR